MFGGQFEGLSGSRAAAPGESSPQLMFAVTREQAVLCVLGINKAAALLVAHVVTVRDWARLGKSPAYQPTGEEHPEI
jgi:hypothetical protein